MQETLYLSIHSLQNNK